MACPYHKEPKTKEDNVVEPTIDGPGEPIPHPPERWIIGNVGEIDPSFFISSVWRLADIYGPIFRLKIFDRSVIVVSSQELVNEICDETRFEKTTRGNLETLRVLAGAGLFTAYTDEHEWYVSHRILIPAMGPIAVRRMFDQMVDCISQMILKWERHGPDYEINTPDDFSRLTFDVIGLCAMNYRFNCFYQEDPPRFLSAMGASLLEAGKIANRSSIENRLRVFSRRELQDNIDYMRSVGEKIISERKANPRPDLDDLLNVMLHGKDPVSGEGMSDELIRDEFITFLIAGHETTSGTMDFMMFNLLKNPDKLQKCYQEVDEVIGDDVVVLEHIPKLKYLWATMRETLRFLGPISGFQRHSKRETVLAGKYKIHPTDSILLNLRGLHHDPAVYGPDPESFRPERFLDGGWESLPPNAWKAFGTGARGCPGRAIAEQEMILCWALMLQRFNFELADPNYTLKIKSTLTIKPDNFKIKARNRPGKSRMVGLAGGQHTGSVYPGVGQGKTAGAGHQADETVDLKPLALFFGGNTGTCKSYAEDIQTSAPNFGFHVPGKVLNLNEAVENLPTDRPVLIFAASYEGQPADNAKNFVAWLESLAGDGDDHSDVFKGVTYAVFGVGNKDWPRTFHRIPILIDDLLARLGATRILPLGLVDVSEDMLGPFEVWKTAVIPVIRKLSGATGEVKSEELKVELVQPEAPVKLAGKDIKTGLVLVNRELVKKGSGPQKKHMEVLLPPGQQYRAGDYLLVLPFNPRENVHRVLTRFGLHANDLLVISGTNKDYLAGYENGPITVFELIASRVELATPASQRQVGVLAESLPENAQLKELASDEGAYRRDVLDKRASVLDLLEDFPDARLTFAEYLAMLQPLTPRQYSISSSPLAYPAVSNPGAFPDYQVPENLDDSSSSQTCSITYDVFEGDASLSGHGRLFHGVASTYLAALAPGARLRCTVRSTSNAKFRLPSDPKTPVILVATGTGIAPMRAFIQERAAIAGARGADALGPAILYYGCRDPDEDFLYRDELYAWQAAGAVTVKPAFSRRVPSSSSSSSENNGSNQYNYNKTTTAHVDEVLWEDREVARGLFRQQGARILVCGSASRLGRAMNDVCIRIYREAFPEKSAEEAEEWLLKQKEDRYLSDVFD